MKVEPGQADMIEFFHHGGFLRPVVLEVTPTCTFPGGDKAPFIVAQKKAAEFREHRIIPHELFAGLNMVVVMVHSTVGVEPALYAFCKILGPVLGGVALLWSTKDNAKLVLTGDHDLRVGRLSIYEDISPIKASLEERTGLLWK